MVKSSILAFFKLNIQRYLFNFGAKVQLFSELSSDSPHLFTHGIPHVHYFFLYLVVNNQG